MIITGVPLANLNIYARDVCPDLGFLPAAKRADQGVMHLSFVFLFFQQVSNVGHK